MPTNTIKPSNESHVVADRVVEVRPDGGADAPKITPMSDKVDAKYVEDLAFMEEEVELMLHPSIDPNDTTRIAGPCIVNGVGLYIPKGEWVKVKRKYLAVILRARQTNWTFTAIQGANGGTKNMEHAIQNARYSIAGIRDMNPKGAGWLQSIQSRPR